MLIEGDKKHKGGGGGIGFPKSKLFVSKTLKDETRTKINEHNYFYIGSLLTMLVQFTRQGDLALSTRS